jgi:hypothetical protein
MLDVDPGTEAGGQTSITVTYYRATDAGPAPLDYGLPGDYAEFESFTLIRPRSDKRRWHARKSPAAVQA